MPPQTQTWRPKPRRRVHSYARIETTGFLAILLVFLRAFLDTTCPRNYWNRGPNTAYT